MNANSGAVAVGFAIGVAVRVAVRVAVAIVIVAGLVTVSSILDEATVWVGPQDELPQEYRVYEPEVVPWDRVEGEGDFPPICAGRSYRERLAG